jgi:hypothetical protein
MKSKDKFKMLKAGIDISKEEAVELKEKYNNTMLSRCREELLLLLDFLSAQRLIKSKDNVVTQTLNLIASMEDTIKDLKKLVEARDLQIKSLNTPMPRRERTRYIQHSNGSVTPLEPNDYIVDDPELDLQDQIDEALDDAGVF